MGKIHYLKGEACFQENDTRSAAIYFQEAIKRYEESSKKSKLDEENLTFYIYAFVSLGEIQQKDHCYSTAITYCRAALNKLIEYEDCFEELAYEKIFIMIIKLFVELYPLQEIYEDDLIYEGIARIKKAIKLYHKFNLNNENRIDYVNAHIVLGEIYKVQNEYRLAIHYYLEAMNLINSWQKSNGTLISQVDYDYYYIVFNSKLAELYDLKEKSDDSSSFELVKIYKSEKPFDNALKIYENLVKFLQELNFPEYAILAETYYKIAEQYSRFSNAYAEIYGEMIYKISQPWMKATDTEKEADLYYQILDSLIVYYGFVGTNFLILTRQRYLELTVARHFNRNVNQKHMIDAASEAIHESAILNDHARKYYEKSIEAFNALLSTIPDAKVGPLKDKCVLSLKRLTVAEKKIDLGWQGQIDSHVIKELKEKKDLIGKVNVLNRHFSNKSSTITNQKKPSAFVFDIHHINSPEYFLLKEQAALSRKVPVDKKLDVVGSCNKEAKKIHFQSENKGDSTSGGERFFGENKKQSGVVAIASRGKGSIEAKRF